VGEGEGNLGRRVGRPSTLGVASARERESDLALLREECRELQTLNFRKLAINACQGGLGGSALRPLYWMLFLKVLDGSYDDWLGELMDHRCTYEYKSRGNIDGEESQKEVSNPSQPEGERERVEEEEIEVEIDINADGEFVDNPLCLEPGSVYNKEAQRQELQSTILLDLRRLPSVFCQNDEVVDDLLAILTVYCTEHNTVSYRQGMHEIAATLHYALGQTYGIVGQMASSPAPGSVDVSNGTQVVREYVGPVDQGEAEGERERESNYQYIGRLLDPQYQRHDTYSMFCKVMEVMGSWYVSGDRKPNERIQADRQKAEIEIRSWNILDILKTHSKDVYLHLMDLDVEPVIFSVRWLRVLFGREFVTEHGLLIWDVILADGYLCESPLRLTNYLAASMLLQLRPLLLRADAMEVLHILMKPHDLFLKASEVEVFHILHRALHLCKAPHVPTDREDTVVTPTSSTLAVPVPLPQSQLGKGTRGRERERDKCKGDPSQSTEQSEISVHLQCLQEFIGEELSAEMARIGTLIGRDQPQKGEAKAESEGEGEGEGDEADGVEAITEGSEGEREDGETADRPLGQGETDVIESCLGELAFCSSVLRHQHPLSDDPANLLQIISIARGGVDIKEGELTANEQLELNQTIRMYVLAQRQELRRLATHNAELRQRVRDLESKESKE
ncbi:hypothetical protein KIPB_002360, partial [Kipferlia bialata]